MDLVPTVDVECINNSIPVSSCGDCSDESMELVSEASQHHVCSSPLHYQLFEGIHHSTVNSTEADESCWLQTNEECNFDFLEGISDTSVDSADLPVPGFTIREIAQKWRDIIEHDENWRIKNEQCDDKSTNGELNMNATAVTALPAKSSSELSEHSASTDCSDSSVQPQPADLTFTKTEGKIKELSVTSSQAVRLNTPFTPNKENSTDLSTIATADIPKASTSQLQIPSTVSNPNKLTVYGEVAVIRECCNPTTEQPSSSVPTHGGTTESSTSKATVHPVATVMKKKGQVVPPNIKPARKLPVKGTATMATKANNALQNSNQSHLPNQELKLKQKELNIKKSLLSKPIVVSKTNVKIENIGSVGPCRPAGLKKPVDKISKKSHPLKLSTMSGHSTPIKDQVVSRRRSVAVSPQRDLSEATDDKSLATKQKRRSGIPLPGGVARDLKAPMSPCNKKADRASNNVLGLSPIAVGKRPFQRTKAKNTRIGIPAPKTQLSFSTSFDPLEGLDLDGPPPGGSKLVHSPAEKENESAVHSQWSPIRRNKGISADEECIRCTKHTAKYL